MASKDQTELLSWSTACMSHLHDATDCASKITGHISMLEEDMTLTSREESIYENAARCRVLIREAIDRLAAVIRLT